MNENSKNEKQETCDVEAVKKPVEIVYVIKVNIKCTQSKLCLYIKERNG